MTIFLRLLDESDKAQALTDVCARVRRGQVEPRSFEVASESFDSLPGKPFAYWVSSAVCRVFTALPSMQRSSLVTSGTGTLDDFRFLRGWWEVVPRNKWFPFAKGGAFSPTYYDQNLVVGWLNDGLEMKAWIIVRYGGGHWARNIRSTEHYFRPGLTWPRRTQGGLSLRAMPAGCIFADKGPAIFVADDDPTELLALLAIVNSRAFNLLVSLQISFGSYEVGVLQKTPVPELTVKQTLEFAEFARRSWSLKRQLDTTNEVSHAFVLPTTLQSRVHEWNPAVVGDELVKIQAEIDGLAFDLYGFSGSDRHLGVTPIGADDDVEPAEDEDGENAVSAHSSEALLSWAFGVVFGRFDWRIATRERSLPPDPEPFDPLPALSPGMLPHWATPFHNHAGILVEDPGHQHDLVHLIDDVLVRVDVRVQDDLRRWLQNDFFAYHLQRYSKSRRKAPIYWPLATASSNYALWLYYPSLNSQTLYTAINDFVEPKLAQVVRDVAMLRNISPARSRYEENLLDNFEALELDLIELRDQLLKIAPTYKPNHDDGVQISAAPLWPLFRHKPWQKLLKETWAKLEKGDYDWAHLAMNYWPDRVREKCKTDKSLAIAHGLESLYVTPEAKPKKSRTKKSDGA